MTIREGLIQREMQSLRTAGFWLCQWGVALLVSTELTLAFIRRNSYESLLATKQLAEGQMLPIGRHLLGTILLAVIAAILSAVTLLVARRYRFYRGLLEHSGESGISVAPGTNGITNLIVTMYFVFPVLDLLLWFYLLAVGGTR
jgi:hypothetical protein